ncbi:MAG: polysaccharide deacetylase family protein [Planctomycetes bacterium]|nr:polysaccharide deacetylase family protein [Planctomycetota bacterium]
MNTVAARFASAGKNRRRFAASAVMALLAALALPVSTNASAAEIGYSTYSGPTVATRTADSAPMSERLPGPRGAAWMVEWDAAAGWAETPALAQNLATIQVFGAVFGPDDNPTLPPRLTAWLEQNPGLGNRAGRSSPGPKLLLTVVNDIVRPDGSSSLKDADLVSRLMATPASRAEHRRRLLALLESGNFAGLDIDYEQVKDADWPVLLSFCGDLAAELRSAGRMLRVVIEPKSKYHRQPLPAGPEYTVMCYNLFGSHSGPGPKADPALIARMGEFRRRSGRNVRLALATGGFVWQENGKTVSINETDAAALAAQYGAKPVRDVNSGCLVFSYTTAAGESHECWYADGATLAGWIQTGRDHGFTDFDIWRLGGNVESSLRQVADALAIGAGKTIHVDAASPGGNGSVQSPLPRIADAISAAGPGDTIAVAPGVYTENLAVATPGLTIAAASPGQGEVVLIGTGGAPTIADQANTVWRNLVVRHATNPTLAALTESAASFEHCRFEPPAPADDGGNAVGADGDRFAVAVHGGSVRFHGCEFVGAGGSALLVAAPVGSRSGAKTEVSYCLLRGFSTAMIHSAGNAATRFANCIAFDNGRLVTRPQTDPGAVSFVNSVLYFNRDQTLANEIAGDNKVVIENSILTPLLNPLLWLTGLLPTEQEGLRLIDSRIASPQFANVGGQLLLNLGIDDTANIGVWEQLAAAADKYGFPVTLAVNTGSADESAWRRIAAVLARGHEAGSHTVSHAVVQAGIPLSLGYARPGAETAIVHIDEDDAGKTMTVEVDGKVAYSRPLADISMQQLTRELRRVGVATRLATYHTGTPARFLTPVGRLDIMFPHPAVPLQLDAEQYQRYELTASYQSIAEQLGMEKIVFISPFQVSSAMARKGIIEAGYVAARSMVEIYDPASPAESGADESAIAADPAVNPRLINIYGLPSFSMNSAKNRVPGVAAMDNVRLILDYAKLDLPALSLYSHRWEEFTLAQWNDVLAIVAADPAIQVVTLLGMIERIKRDGEAVGENLYLMPAKRMELDFRPRPGSPLFQAGKNLGLASDFTGAPVPVSGKPTIGLHQ